MNQHAIDTRIRSLRDDIRAIKRVRNFFDWKSFSLIHILFDQCLKLKKSQLADLRKKRKAT